MRIMFVASEAVPYAKTGGMGDVVGSLPKYLRKLGHRVVIVLPKYRGVPADRVVIPSLTIPMGRSFKFCSVVEPEGINDVSYFLVDYPTYYDREALYRVSNQDYPDNAERFAYLCWAALEFAKRASQAPDIIHCNDWQSALVPVILKVHYSNDPFFARTRTLLTIHNLAFQGVFPRSALGAVSLPDSLFNAEQMEYFENVNFLKGGILFADKLTTVSQRYSQEIRTEEFGYGLEGVLRKRAQDLTGILNGVDYSDWDPLTDIHIAANYSAENLEGKKICKRSVLRELGIADSSDRPLIGIVSRLADQKGFDLLCEVVDAVVQDGLSLAVLGTGEERYCRFFLKLQQEYPLYVGVKIAYDEKMAHKIEAGADMFLMPSRFEPCGLNQIYSLKYGTVPIVRATGGLDDTVIDYSEPSGGNGFKFSPYTPEELLQTIRRAVEVYHDPQAWRALVKTCMQYDYSWSRSAEKYSELYQSLMAA
jgi:starch synthase